jgi:transposase-like protein
MARKKSVRHRREYSEELKEEAVQMLLDGHSAQSVASNLGLSPSRWTDDVRRNDRLIGIRMEWEDRLESAI